MRGGDYGHGHEPVRKPQVQLIRNEGKRDGTTGMFVEVAADAFNPVGGIAAGLRGRSEPTASSPAVADFGADSSYLDIPAFLRRQAD